MKKLSVLFALLAVAMFAMADDLVVSFDDFEATPGSEEIPLRLVTNVSMDAYCAYQFDLYLPEGLVFDEDEEDDDFISWAESGAWREEKKAGKWIAMHSYQTGTADDPGAIRFLIMDGSINNALFADTNEMIVLFLKALDSFAGGTIKVANIVFSSPDQSQYKPADIELVYTIGETQTEVSFTMTAAHAGTLILPFDAEIPADYDWVAYSDITLNGKTLVLGESTTTLLANTPYYIEGEKEGTYVFTGTATNETASVTNGVLTGVFVDTEVAAGVGNYVLQNQAGKGVAFYNVKTKAKTVPAYRCYITVSSDTQSNMYRIGGTTNIDEVTVDDNADVYDMLGRKVIGPLEKGVYIKGNRKIYVK